MNGGILQYVVIFEYATSFGVYHVLIEVDGSTQCMNGSGSRWGCVTGFFWKGCSWIVFLVPWSRARSCRNVTYSINVCLGDVAA
jgi:hypothetical protein